MNMQLSERVDTPLVTTALLLELAGACRDAAVPQTGPLPGAYRKRALPALESGERSSNSTSLWSNLTRRCSRT